MPVPLDSHHSGSYTESLGEIYVCPFSYELPQLHRIFLHSSFYQSVFQRTHFIDKCARLGSHRDGVLTAIAHGWNRKTCREVRHIPLGMRHRTSKMVR